MPCGAVELRGDGVAGLPAVRVDRTVSGGIIFIVARDLCRRAFQVRGNDKQVIRVFSKFTLVVTELESGNFYSFEVV